MLVLVGAVLVGAAELTWWLWWSEVLMVAPSLGLAAGALTPKLTGAAATFAATSTETAQLY